MEYKASIRFKHLSIFSQIYSKILYVHNRSQYNVEINLTTFRANLSACSRINELINAFDALYGPYFFVPLFRFVALAPR